MLQAIKHKFHTLLRSSEKYFKTDMVYVGKNGFWLILQQIVGTAVSFVLSIMFARYLSKETFGIYKYILSVAGFVSAFSLSGMNTAIVRAVSQGYDGTFARSLSIQLRFTLGQFLATLAVALYYYIHGNTIQAAAFGLIALCGPISTVANSFSSYLQGKQDFKRSSLYGIYSNIIYFALVAIATIFFPNVLYLIAAYYVSTTFANVFFCFLTLKKFPPKNKELREEDLAYAKNMSLMTIIGSAANQIDSIIVYKLLGPAQLAVYAFSTIVPDRIRSIFSIVTSLALPKLAQKNISSEGINRKTIQITIVAILIIVFYILLAPFFYQTFFPQYVEAVWYSEIYVLSLLVLPSFISLPTLYAERKEKALYIINIGLPIVKIVVSLIAIVAWGILGAIIAKLVHYLLHMILSGYYSRAGRKETSAVQESSVETNI